MAKMSLLSVPGSVLIKTTLMKSLAEALWCTQIMFLSKQVLTIVLADAQMIEVPGAYTHLRWSSTTSNIPWGKEASIHG